MAEQQIRPDQIVETWDSMATGTWNITGTGNYYFNMGFKPRMVDFWWRFGNDTNRSTWNRGIALIGDGKQYSVHQHSSEMRRRTNRSILLTTNGNNNYISGRVSSVDDNGMTVNVDNYTASQEYIWIAYGSKHGW